MRKSSFAEILQKIDGGQLKKLSVKVPEWSGVELEIPSSLNVEQCSSSATARYKAKIASKCCDSGRIADLTGGLGVDSYFFSKRFGKVLHNEMNGLLSDAVRKNFSKLGVMNAEFCSMDANSKEFLEKLVEFGPSVIFLDPARRSECGKKVFLLEECSPDVCSLIPGLTELDADILIKLSPMADITMLRNRLPVSEIHIVEAKGECKELLCLLGRGKQDFSITVTDLKDSLNFTPEEELSADASFADPSEVSSDAGFLFEPGAALMKSGSYKLICDKFGLKMLSADAHLYLSGDNHTPLGKSYSVLEVLPFCSESIRILGKKYPYAEVSSRGIRMKSEDLRERLGVKSGGDIHIFGTLLSDKSKVLIVTKTV